MSNIYCNKERAMALLILMIATVTIVIFILILFYMLAHVQLACSEEAPKHIRRMRAAVTRFVFISAS